MRNDTESSAEKALIHNAAASGTSDASTFNGSRKRRSLRVDNLNELVPSVIAWPTVLLALIALSLWGFSLAQVLQHGFQWRWLCLSTLSAYLAFTPCHDAAHHAITGGHHRHNNNNNNMTRFLVNEAIGQLCGIPLLAPFTAFRYAHLLHHKYTNDPEKDPDMHAQGGGLFHWFTIELSYYVFLIRHYREVPPHIICIALATQMLNIGGMVWLSRQYTFSSVLYGIIIPQRLAAGILAYFFDYVPHHSAEERGIGYRTTKHVTRFFAGDKRTSSLKQTLLSFIMVGQDAHVIHHLYPQLPFYKYHAVWNKHEKDLYSLGVDQTSLF